MSAVGDTQRERISSAVDALRGQLLYLECDLVDLDDIAHIRQLVGKVRAMLDGVDADLARRGRDLRRGGDDDGEVDAALNPHRRQAESKPPRDEARGELFDELPELGDATRSGDVPGEYSDVITRALKPLTDQERNEFLRRHRDVHELAGRLGLEAFRRRIKAMVDDVLRDSGRDLLARQRRLRTARVGFDPETAMTTLFAKFDLETGTRVKHAINVEMERLIHQRRDDPHDTRTRDQLLADAVANLICGARTEGRQGTDLVVLVDLYSLLDGLDHQQTPANNTADTTTATNDNTAASGHGPPDFSGTHHDHHPPIKPTVPVVPLVPNRLAPAHHHERDHRPRKIGSTPDAGRVKPQTGLDYRSVWCDGWPAMPTSSPSCSRATVSCWTKAAANDSPPANNASPYEPCTTPAPSMGAARHSTGARSTTSIRSGHRPTATPTSAASYLCARDITTSYTTTTGNSTSAATAISP